MAPPSSVPANAAAVAGRGGSECRICPNHRLTAVAGVRPTPSFYPFILLSFLSFARGAVLSFACPRFRAGLGSPARCDLRGDAEGSPSRRCSQEQAKQGRR